jgi:hypothetical protein
MTALFLQSRYTIDMKILNLVPDYIKTMEEKDPLESYFSIFPALFEHYFSYWSNKELPFVKNFMVIKHGEKLLLDSISNIERKFAVAGLNLDSIHIVFFVGQNTTNGHAAKLNGKWWVWIPVEMYATQRQVDAFLPHEMIHGLQYAQQPNLYFSTQAEKEKLSRQLIIEGIATWSTMRIMQIEKREALWADFISDEDYSLWIQQYEINKKALLEFAIENWNGGSKGLFLANNKKDIFQFRAGYLMGLALVDHIAKGKSVATVIGMNTIELNKFLALAIKKERDEMSRS